MFEIVKEEAPNYLINLIPKCEWTTRTRDNYMLTRKMYFYDDSRFDEKNELILEVTVT